jgi:type VI secretion system protein ImpH
MQKGYAFDFFRALQLLEHQWNVAHIESASSPIRLKPDPSVVFPNADISTIKRTGTVPHEVEVQLRFMGLYGVASPLPSYFYSDISKDFDTSKPVADFLDIFNHRLYAYFYKAWKKYRPSVFFSGDADDVHSKRFLALAGLGTSGALQANPLSKPMLIAASSLLVGPNRNARGLQSLLHYFLAVPVQICENIARWVNIPERPRMGRTNQGLAAVLGQTSIIGARIHDVAGKIRIVLGPMPMSEYAAYKKGAPQAVILTNVLKLYLSDFLTYDVLLKLRPDQEQTTLGGRTFKLGLNTMIGQLGQGIEERLISYT